MLNLTQVFGAVIITGLVYLVGTVLRYMKFLEVTRPNIKNLRGQAAKLEKGLEAEEKVGQAVRGQLEDLKTSISNAKLDVVEAEKALFEARQREERLEIARYKKDFKKRSR